MTEFVVWVIETRMRSLVVGIFLFVNGYLLSYLGVFNLRFWGAWIVQGIAVFSFMMGFLFILGGIGKRGD